MTRVTPHSTIFDLIKDKVVVVSDGTSAVGAATVARLSNSYAKVVYGDKNASALPKFTAQILYQHEIKEEATPVECDVTVHADVYKLFQTAHNKYGRVDHAIAIPDRKEEDDWFHSELTVESVEEPANIANFNINVKGTAIFAMVAVTFLRTGIRKGDHRSLTLTSSVAGLQDCPGLCLYQASQLGILGLMRSMCKPIYERDGIRINCVCNKIEEFLVAHSGAQGHDLDDGIQNADDCARFYVGIMNNTSMNGKSIYIDNGKGWEFEDGLRRTMSRWLGKVPAKMLIANSKLTGKIDSKSYYSNSYVRQERTA